MTRFIEHIIEPRRLLLCWQAIMQKVRAGVAVNPVRKDIDPDTGVLSQPGEAQP